MFLSLAFGNGGSCQWDLRRSIGCHTITFTGEHWIEICQGQDTEEDDQDIGGPGINYSYCQRKVPLLEELDTLVQHAAFFAFCSHSPPQVSSKPVGTPGGSRFMGTFHPVTFHCATAAPISQSKNNLHSGVNAKQIYG